MQRRVSQALLSAQGSRVLKAEMIHHGSKNKKVEETQKRGWKERTGGTKQQKGPGLHVPWCLLNTTQVELTLGKSLDSGEIIPLVFGQTFFMRKRANRL